jgi:alcohol dehydrogenase class IV
MNTLPESLTLPLRTLARVGAARDLLRECRTFGPRGLLVHGASLAAGGTLQAMLDGTPPDMTVATWQHPGGEPTLDDVEAALACARGHEVGWVAGVGGGSVMDVAKACAGLLHSPLPVQAYHDGAPLLESRVPFAAVPTTAGTGSEATVVSVLTNARSGVKKSFRHASHMARLVILDARLLAACPRPVIASSGMDALVQAIESYVSREATWFSDEVALKAVALVRASLESVYRNAGDLAAATDLLHGSYLAGLALSNARLGVVHGLAHPLGARYRQPHGLVCGVCILPALEFNRPVIGKKYDRMCAAAGGDLRQTIAAMMQSLDIRSPFAGQPIRDRDAIVRETLESGSTAANPRPVSAADADALLTRIFS